MIAIADARWGHVDRGQIDVAVPVEDVDLLADVVTGADPADLERELLSLVRPTDLVFDIGASVGCFALAAAARGARVVAVEASPRRVDHLRLSATVNGSNSLTIVHAAVGRTAGTARYLSRRSDRRVVEGSSSNALVEIAMTTVADLVGRHGSPDVVRIRTPGWEIDVLSTLGGCRAVGLGADLVAAAKRGRDWRALVAALASGARAVTWLDGIRRRPLDATRPHPEEHFDLLGGVVPDVSDTLSDTERIGRYEVEAFRNPGAIRARLASDLRHGGALLDDERVQAVLERLLLDPAERVVRAVTWWRAHPARRTSVVDRARALQSVLATRLSLD